MKLKDLPPEYRAQAERQIRRPASLYCGRPGCDRGSGAGKPREDDRFDMTNKVVKFFHSADKIGFVIDVNPDNLGTAQQKGVRPFIGKDGKPHAQFYTKASIAKSYRRISEAIRPYRSFTSDWPDDAPIVIKCLYLFPYPKSTPKCHLPPKGMVGPHITVPDVDNIWKKTGDVLTEIGLWFDDKQINDLIIGKRRINGRPSIYLTVERIRPVDPADHKTKTNKTNKTNPPQGKEKPSILTANHRE